VPSLLRTCIGALNFKILTCKLQDSKLKASASSSVGEYDCQRHSFIILNIFFQPADDAPSHDVSLLLDEEVPPPGTETLPLENEISPLGKAALELPPSSPTQGAPLFTLSDAQATAADVHLCFSPPIMQ
jgi:hypothetical protein